MTPEASHLGRMLTALAGRPTNSRPFEPARINWDLLQNLVRQHRLTPLLFRLSSGELEVPEPIRAQWEEGYRRQLARSVIQGDCLRGLLGEFFRRGIEAIVLKGAHLAQCYYPHPALRPADDIDLLLRPGDSREAGEILKKGGFQLREQTATAEKYLLPRTAVFIEIHHDLQNPGRKNPAFEIKIEDFRRTSISARIAGIETRVLSPLHNLLYLAAHLSHHSFSRLIWFYDIYLVIEKSGVEIDWERLAQKAKEYRCAAQIYYPLLFTNTFFGRTAPPEILRRLAPGPAKRLIIRRFLRPNAVLENKIPLAGLGALRNRFLLNDSWLLAGKRFWFLSLNIPAKTI